MSQGMSMTPAIAGWTMPASDKSGLMSSGLKLPALSAAFAASLRWAVRNPLRSVAFALVLPVLGFMSMPLLTAQFFPGVDRDQFHKLAHQIISPLENKLLLAREKKRTLRKYCHFFHTVADLCTVVLMSCTIIHLQTYVASRILP